MPDDMIVEISPIAPPAPTLLFAYDENLDSVADPMEYLNRGYKPVDLGMAGELAQMYYETAGSHMRYHTLTMMACFAAAIQHRFLAVTWGRGKKLRPNIYGAILGHTSMDHKSVAFNRVPILMPFSEMDNCKRLPGYFTEEGLYKEFAERPFGIITKDEIGTLFASREKKHLESVIPFLTGVYDGGVEGKRLASAQYDEKDVSLTIIGATTFSEFLSSTKDRDWNSGWLVRWLYALPDDVYSPVTRLRDEEPSDARLQDRARALLRTLSKAKATTFEIDKPAWDYLQAWRDDFVLEAYKISNENPRIAALVERYATYAYKFSMILCAVRGNGQRIMRKEAEDAARLAENFTSNAYALYKYGEKNRVSSNILQKIIFRLCAVPGNGGMTVREIGRAMNMGAEVRDIAIEKLVALNAVVIEERGKSKVVIAVVDRLQQGRLTVDLND
jgi:hypothetical protein